MYDVIIIGAGPAGSTAAKTLSERGLRVLVAEKCRMPRVKSCSGILIQKTLELVGRYFGEMPPPAVQCAPAENRGMIFTDERGREYRFAQGGLNIWRSAFDHWLAERAQESGVELRDGVAAVACAEEGGAVTVALRGKTDDIQRAGYVLDCEGVVGAVKGKLIPGARQSIITYQTFNEGGIDLDPHYFYAYLQPEFSGYDAWFNEKDGLLVLGVSAQDAGGLEAYHRRFLEYLRSRHGLRLGRQVSAEKWLMPRIRPGCPVDYGVGRVLFAGEAAGFLNPMGEGISAAMESGRCAAHAVAEKFDRPEAVLEDYRRRTAGLKAYMQRQWDFVAGRAAAFREMKME